MVIHDVQEINLIDINSSKKILIMFPFAGGNSYSYQQLFTKFEPHFDIICPELKGRGVYSDQEPITNINSLVDDLFDTWMSKIILSSDYVMYGHSMGALICYLLCHRMMESKMKMPEKIIISGRGAPACVREKITYNLADEEFKVELKKLGGVSDDVLNDNELLEYFMPILRADFEAVETYEHLAGKKLQIPITVVTGKDEQLSNAEILAWQDETENEVDFFQLEGDHFFIYTQLERLSSIVVSCVYSGCDLFID